MGNEKCGIKNKSITILVLWILWGMSKLCRINHYFLQFPPYIWCTSSLKWKTFNTLSSVAGCAPYHYQNLSSRNEKKSQIWAYTCPVTVESMTAASSCSPPLLQPHTMNEWGYLLVFFRQKFQHHLLDQPRFITEHLFNPIIHHPWLFFFVSPLWACFIFLYGNPISIIPSLSLLSQTLNSFSSFFCCAFLSWVFCLNDPNCRHNWEQPL